MPPAHWVALYRDLERTLAAIMLEDPVAGRRLWDVRVRLHHWETQAQRLAEPPAAIRALQASRQSEREGSAGAPLRADLDGAAMQPRELRRQV